MVEGPHKWQAGFIPVAGLGIVAGVSYLFALAGHPGSVWLWRDVLGVL